jgi:hypothetical protein
MTIRVQLFPTTTHLGQPFVYRLTLRHTRPFQPLPPPPKPLLPAEISGKPRITKISSTEWHLRIPLVVYQIRAFGALSLPAWSLRIQDAEGSEREIAIPAVRLDVKARYQSEHRFQDADDPNLPFLPAPKADTPSSEWRFAGAYLPKSTSNWGILLLSILLGALALGGSLFFWWLRQRKPVSLELPASPSPFEVALSSLRSLTPPTDPENPSLHERYHRGIAYIVRSYLQERLAMPLLPMTIREIKAIFEEQQAEDRSITWAASLSSWLEAMEHLRFAGFLSSMEAMAAEKQRAIELLQQIERWKKQKEAAEAAAASAASSSPRPPPPVAPASSSTPPTRGVTHAF